MLSRSLIKNGDWIIDPYYGYEQVPIYEIIDLPRVILRGEDGESFYGSIENHRFCGPKSSVDRLVRLIKLSLEIKNRLFKLGVKSVYINKQMDTLIKNEQDKIVAEREYENDLSGSGKEKSYTITL